MDNKQFKNPLISPIAISRVNLPIVNTREDPLFIFYIVVLGEIQFFAFPIKATLTPKQLKRRVEIALRYIKMEFSKEYILVTKLEPGDFLTIQNVDKIMAEQKAKIMDERKSKIDNDKEIK